jgi:cell division protein FtsL
MNRLNIFLLVVVLACALSVVNSTNQQRQLFVQLERAQSEESQLQQDYAQLQYEQGALAKTSRIEDLASGVLKMQAPTAGSTQYLTLGASDAQAADAPIPVAAASAPTASQGRGGAQ